MNSKAGRQTFFVMVGGVLLIAALIVAVVYWRSRPATEIPLLDACNPRYGGVCSGTTTTESAKARQLRKSYPFQKGVVYVSWRRGEYASAESDQTLADVVKPTGVNWISIVVTCHQTSLTATEIQCDSDRTPTDDDVRHAVDYTHGLGLQVMLKPHTDVLDGVDWRGGIDMGDDEAAWQRWFASYTSFITHYATLAQDTGVDYFVVGTELAGTSDREADWRAVVAAVRAEYHGPLTYAANHGDEVLNLTWWDALDAIGVDAYYPLTDKDDPTVEELKAAWTPIVERLGLLSTQWNRPVILTEVGYQSRDGANRTPWHVETKAIDLQEQADCYQAVFESFAGHEWWRGVFWWYWSVLPDHGGPENSDFSANNKPAENVLRLNYGAPPRP